MRSWLHSQGHRWAEHGGVLVLCSREGNNVCKKLLGKCDSFPAFLQQSQGLSQKQFHCQWQQLNSQDHLLPLSGRAVWLHFKWKESLAQNRGVMPEAVCVINRKAARKQLAPRWFPFPLSVIANWKRWERHNGVSAFITIHSSTLKGFNTCLLLQDRAPGFQVSNPGWLVALSVYLSILWKPSNLFSLVNKKLNLSIH